MISVKKKTSEVHVINKKTCARPSKKEAELHEFLEQYLRIFRAISTSNPTYSKYIVHIFQHHTKHILSILEIGSGICITTLGTSHFRRILETSVINHRNGSGMVREWVVSRSSALAVPVRATPRIIHTYPGGSILQPQKSPVLQTAILGFANRLMKYYKQ